jgi:hypothetical protein
MRRFFPLLPETASVEGDRISAQISGWRDWKGKWRMAEGGDVALYGPYVTLDIKESGEGLPLMNISVLSDAKKPLVLLPAAYHRDEKTGIIWVVRDMDVAVVMKEPKSSTGGESQALSLEIWQNSVAYKAQRI